MASLTLATSATSASSFCGQKLAVKPSVSSKRTSVRVAAPRAKYGDESVYFDLKDIKNTTGSWDLYGSDSKSPYNPLQAKFFETFAGAFTKRGVLLKFLVVGGALTVGQFAGQYGEDLLPIKKGPKAGGEKGPNGKI